jgi:hypothetical protein
VKLNIVLELESVTVAEVAEGGLVWHIGVFNREPKHSVVVFSHKVIEAEHWVVLQHHVFLALGHNFLKPFLGRNSEVVHIHQFSFSSEKELQFSYLSVVEHCHSLHDIFDVLVLLLSHHSQDLTHYSPKQRPKQAKSSQIHQKSVTCEHLEPSYYVPLSGHNFVIFGGFEQAVSISPSNYFGLQFSGFNESFDWGFVEFSHAGMV